MLGIPTDLDALETSGLLSAHALAEVRADADRPTRDPVGDAALGDAASGDVAVGELVRARLGDEAFEVLVDPLLSGVNAGRADELSAELGAMQILAAARADASLVRGARHVLARATAPAGDGPPTPVFLSVPGGMGRVVTALVEAIGPDRVRPDSPVRALQRQHDGYHLDGNGLVGPFDGVVLACPAPTSADLVTPMAAVAAEGLRQLRYASVALVALAYRPEQLPGPLRYSGFLVPRRAGRFLTACSWSSAKFTHLGADGTVRLRASVGRSDDTRFVTMSDEEIVNAIDEELRELMSIDGGPFAWRVHRWMNALPQYRPGHAQQVAAWEADLAANLPGVVLAGTLLRGLGIPACIASGRQAARTLFPAVALNG
jgi:oxygen-dependent protoporphyrinogen oxidase